MSNNYKIKHPIYLHKKLKMSEIDPSVHSLFKQPRSNNIGQYPFCSVLDARIALFEYLIIQ